MLRWHSSADIDRRMTRFLLAALSVTAERIELIWRTTCVLSISNEVYGSRGISSKPSFPLVHFAQSRENVSIGRRRRGSIEQHSVNSPISTLSFLFSDDLCNALGGENARLEMTHAFPCSGIFFCSLKVRHAYFLRYPGWLIYTSGVPSFSISRACSSQSNMKQIVYCRRERPNK